MGAQHYANRPCLSRAYCEGRASGDNSGTRYATGTSGTEVAENAITWTAKRGGNGLVVRLLNPGLSTQPLSVSVAGSIITASLATNGTGTSGVEGNNNGLTWSRLPAVLTAVVVDLVDPAGNDQALAITTETVEATTTITISLATGSGGAITTTGAQVIAAITADEDASEYVTVAHTGTSTGAAAVTDQTVTIAALAITTTGDLLKGAISDYALSHALVGTADTGGSDGSGVVVATVVTLTGSSNPQIPLSEEADAWDAGFVTGTNTGADLARDYCAVLGKAAA